MFCNPVLLRIFSDDFLDEKISFEQPRMTLTYSGILGCDDSRKQSSPSHLESSIIGRQSDSPNTECTLGEIYDCESDTRKRQQADAGNSLATAKCEETWGNDELSGAFVYAHIDLNT